MPERIDLKIADGIAEVAFNRPEKRNALDFATFAALAGIGERLRQTQGLRAVVLYGKGRSFSAGIDLEALSHDGGTALANLAERTHGEANLFQHCVLQWRDLPVPVIAALHGHALGGGMQLALGADIRIAAPDAKLSIREIVWGLVPDMAGMVLLRQIVRADVLRDLLFTGRIVSGEEAVQLGLVTRLADDPVAAAFELAREMAAFSPDALRAAKRLANSATDSDDKALLLAEAVEQQALLASFNHREALQAHQEQRPPRYRD